MTLERLIQLRDESNVALAYIKDKVSAYPGLSDKDYRPEVFDAICKLNAFLTVAVEDESRKVKVETFAIK